MRETADAAGAHDINPFGAELQSLAVFRALSQLLFSTLLSCLTATTCRGKTLKYSFVE